MPRYLNTPTTITAHPTVHTQTHNQHDTNYPIAHSSQIDGPNGADTCTTLINFLETNWQHITTTRIHSEQIPLQTQQQPQAILPP